MSSNETQNFKIEFFTLRKLSEELLMKSLSNEEAMNFIVQAENLILKLENISDKDDTINRMRAQILSMIQEFEKKLTPLSQEVVNSLENILKHLWEETLEEVKIKQNKEYIYPSIKNLEDFRFNYINTLWHTSNTNQTTLFADYLDGKVNSMQNKLINQI